MLKAINKRIRNKKGFTLVELIVVLAVLGIIAAIAVPRFTGVQETAKEKADAASLEIVKKAAELYVVAEGISLPVDDLPVEDLINNGYLDSEPVSQVNPANNTVKISVDEDGKATVTWDEKQE